MQAPEFTGFKDPVQAAYEAPMRDGATEKQLAFIASLREQKALTDEQRIWLDRAVEAGFDKRRASVIIEKLLALPNAAPAKAEHEEPAADRPEDGFYALRNVPGHKNEISFFRLRTGKHGRWEGFQFIDMVIGGEPGRREPVKGVGRIKVYDCIAEQGADEARQLFGQEIGCCGRCGRTLTDDLSRERGIGPDCWGMMGF